MLGRCCTLPAVSASWSCIFSWSWICNFADSNK